ncbi:MAG: hypothetical protein ACR2H2_14100 [Solirubrobacteraceae bacterium]
MSPDPVSVMSASEVVGLCAAARDEHGDDARRELLARVPRPAGAGRGVGLREIGTA